MEGEVKIETWIILLGNLDMCVLFSFKDRKDSIKRHICFATHNCQSMNGGQWYDKLEVKIMKK